MAADASASTRTFIRVIEVWVPDATGSMLEFAAGLYGTARRFGAVSKTMCFGRGEGLPGQAWERGRPIVLKVLEGSTFRRIEAASAEGLTSAIALPIFNRHMLTSVLVIFCGEGVGESNGGDRGGAAQAGAIELWRNDPAASADLELDDGYYGSTAEVFEFISRQTSFRKGTGLPGLAWESAMPVFFPDLGKGTRFLRSDSAEKVGINRGLAMPCTSTDACSYVMTFLSALATPIVKRFETWVPGADGRHLQRTEGFCESAGLLGPHAAVADHIARGVGAIGRACETRVPMLVAHAADEPGSVGAAALESGLGALAAVPVLKDGAVTAVVAWYF